MRRALLQVVVNGQDVTSRMRPLLASLRVVDKAGAHSDTATMRLNDTEGQVILPVLGASVEISLGWEDWGIALVFRGTVDEVRAIGGRSGRFVVINAKGADTTSRIKEPQARHFDGRTVEQILAEAGASAGVTTVRVAERFRNRVRPYLDMRDESFLALGQRLARELGSTFKVAGRTAILAERNGGVTATGAQLPDVTAGWGVNLHEYDIAPQLGRPQFGSTRVRYYDSSAAAWKEAETPTARTGSTAVLTTRFPVADADEAGDLALSDGEAVNRHSGEGSVTIEGNPEAQPESEVTVAGARPGIDGTYRIDSVEHEFSRARGFVTRLALRQPQGGAGADFRLPPDFELG